MRKFKRNYIDKDYVEPLLGHGGAGYVFDEYDLVPTKITYIYGVPWYRLLWYNTVLWWRWMKRKGWWYRLRY